MSEINARNPLLTDSPPRTLWRLGWPMAWGLLLTISFNVVDTWFIAKLGTKYLAAISFTFPVAMMLGSLSLGLGTGVASIIARAMGEGDKLKVRRLTTDSLILSLMIVVLFAVAGLLTIQPLFQLLGATDETMPLIQEYMRIWYGGMIFLVVPMVGNSAIRATGDTRIPALIMTVAGALNILLDPLLIFGLGPIPALGMAGAAVATVIARATTLAAALWILGHKLQMLDFRIPSVDRLRHSFPEILHVGLPAAGTNMIVPLSAGLITRFVAEYGAGAVAGFGIASRVESLALIPIIGLASGLAPFVGQNHGAGMYQRIHSGMASARRFAVLWGLPMAVVLALFGAPLAMAFDTHPAVLQTATLYLLTVPFSYPLQGWAMLTGTAFNAVGNPLPAAVLAITRVLFLYIPLAWVGGHIWQLPGIFGAAAAANVITGGIAWLAGRRLTPA